MATIPESEIERRRAVVTAAREAALQAKADAVRIRAHNKADNIRRRGE